MRKNVKIMSFRIKEVKEINNKEETMVCNATKYELNDIVMPNEDARKKLEKPKYVYVPTDEVRSGPFSDNGKGKLR